MPEEYDRQHLIALLTVIQDMKQTALLKRVAELEIADCFKYAGAEEKLMVQTARFDRAYAIEKARSTLS